MSAYNANRGLIVYMRFTGTLGGQSLVLRPKFGGLKLVMPIPLLCVPPLTPASGCRDQAGREHALALNRFQLKIAAVRNRRSGRVLFRTPRTCPAGGWKFKSDIRYSDGTSVAVPEHSPCRR